MTIFFREHFIAQTRLPCWSESAMLSGKSILCVPPAALRPKGAEWRWDSQSAGDESREPFPETLSGPEAFTGKLNQHPGLPHIKPASQRLEGGGGSPGLG